MSEAAIGAAGRIRERPRRELRRIEGPQGPRLRIQGREVLSLSSSNYLGLADHPRVRKAAADAAERHGAGTASSPLNCGHTDLHRRLEGRLAEFHERQSALLFGSGYLANLGAIAALAGPGDVVFTDEHNHASIADGCRLSGAETFVYRHCDIEHLNWGLRKAGPAARLIATDGLFAIEGDLAPLPELAELARIHDCLLLVDEGHAVGALGPGGRGSAAAAGVADQVDIVIGSLGKALGSYGAYVSCSIELRERLIAEAPCFSTTSSLPPPVLGAATAALSLLAASPGVVEHLRRNAELLRSALAAEGLDTGRSRSQVMAIATGDPDLALALADRALEGSVVTEPLPEPETGSSCVRIAVMANHRADELHAAAAVLAEAALSLGLEGRRPAGRTSELRAA